MWMPTTSPITMKVCISLPAASFGWKAMLTLHSSAAGAAATRGAFTIIDGAISMPAWSNSLTLSGASIDDAFIFSARSRLARLATNSPVSTALRALSLGWSEQNMTLIGLLEIMLKKEYGARFGIPSRLTVDIQPIGRGATIALLGSCGR